jgi:hypothetical protein
MFLDAANEILEWLRDYVKDFSQKQSCLLPVQNYSSFSKESMTMSRVALASSFAAY